MVSDSVSSPISRTRITLEEQARLVECAREPIRTPGAVQPHGAVVVADAVSFIILQASANSLDVLGFPAEWLLGQQLAEVFGDGPFEQFIDVIEGPTAAANPTLVAVSGRSFDAIVHRTNDLVIIDFEPSLIATDAQSTANLYAAIHRLARLTTLPDVWAEAAREVRRVTHFDHVMVYHFHEDDHGEIVAEELAEGMEPYLGLHYPASDIPPQARALYLLKLSRVIATTGEESSALVSVAEGESAALIDLSESELRSVSPRHLEFMRNMGQASTMSFSLIYNDRLIGMITCAHRTPRRVPYVVRQGLEILANQVALQLSSITSIEHLTRRAEARSVRASIVANLTEDVDIAEALLFGAPTMLDLVAADGAAVRLGGIVRRVGRTPSLHELAALADSLVSNEGGLLVVTDALPLDYPALAALVSGVAGLLVVPLGGEGDFIAWFRDELVHSVRWLGDQTVANRSTPLSPRNSFSAWSQDVTGTSAGWDGLEADAAELGRDVDSALLRRAESRLAHVALHDPLTGLPNRRLLMDRVEHALTKYARGEEVALLFIDVDGFKSINDALGHEAGDEVLRRTATRLLTTARAQDTVSRIGGDEFVVLCENTTAEEADILANRILTVMRVAGRSGSSADVSVTVSIGITTANLSFDAAGLLRQADAAMYRAKERGRDQLSR